MQGSVTSSLVPHSSLMISHLTLPRAPLLLPDFWNFPQALGYPEGTLLSADRTKKSFTPPPQLLHELANVDKKNHLS